MAMAVSLASPRGIRHHQQSAEADQKSTGLQVPNTSGVFAAGAEEQKGETARLVRSSCIKALKEGQHPPQLTRRALQAWGSCLRKAAPVTAGTRL